MEKYCETRQQQLLHLYQENICISSRLTNRNKGVELKIISIKYYHHQEWAQSTYLKQSRTNNNHNVDGITF